MSFGLLQRDIDFILSALKDNPHIEKCTIFGSRAMGNFKPGSDIDLAISGKNVTQSDVVRLSGILNEEMPIPYVIDLVHLDKVDSIELKEHIIHKGIELYKK